MSSPTGAREAKNLISQSLMLWQSQYAAEGLEILGESLVSNPCWKVKKLHSDGSKDGGSNNSNHSKNSKKQEGRQAG